MSSRYASTDEKYSDDEGDGAGNYQPLQRALGRYKEAFETLVDGRKESTIDRVVLFRQCCIDILLLYHAAFSDCMSEQAALSLDAFMLVLAFGRDCEDQSPVGGHVRVIGLKTFNEAGYELGDHNTDRRVATAFAKWSAVRAKRGARPNTEELDEVLSAIKAVTERVESQLIRINDVVPLVAIPSGEISALEASRTSLLKAPQPATAQRTRNRNTSTAIAVLPMDEDQIRGDGIAGAMAAGSMRVMLGVVSVAVCLGVYGAFITSRDAIAAGYLAIPIVGILLALGLAVYVMTLAAEEQRLRVNQPSDQRSVEMKAPDFSKLSTFIALTLLKLEGLAAGKVEVPTVSSPSSAAVGSHFLSVPPIGRRYSSNNSASIMLNKSSTLPVLGAGEQPAGPVSHWPALDPAPRSPPHPPEDVVTIRLDPAGTLVLPFSANLRCPILLDGYHVHQHIALFGVGLTGRAEGNSIKAPSPGADQSAFASSLEAFDDEDDTRFTICMWNDAVSRITGFGSDSVLFHPLADVVADEKSYDALKTLMRNMEQAAEMQMPFPVVNPFRISILTSASERLTLTVTAAPVTEIISGSPLEAEVPGERLIGVMFLGSLGESREDVYQWQGQYYSVVMRCLTRATRVEQEEETEKVLAKEATDAELGTARRFYFNESTISFKRLGANMLQFAAEQLSGGLPVTPAIFTLTPSERKRLTFRKSQLSKRLTQLLQAKGLETRTCSVTVRSTVPNFVEVDLSNVADFTATLLSSVTRDERVSGPPLSVNCAPFGKHQRGLGTVALSLRVTGLRTSEIDAIVESLEECFMQKGEEPRPEVALLMEKLRSSGIFVYTSPSSTEEGSTLVIVFPARAQLQCSASNNEGPTVNVSEMVVRASQEVPHVSRSTQELSFAHAQSFTILVANSASIDRANLMRLLFEGHNAVFPVLGSLFPKAALVLRTCGRSFDAVFADVPELASGDEVMKDIYALCFEFSTTAFILRHKGISKVIKPTIDQTVSPPSAALGITWVDPTSIKTTQPPNLHFVDISHTPMSQRQLVKYIGKVALETATAARKNQEIRNVLQGHRNSPWQRGKRLGKGSFGEVFEAHMTLTGGVAAVKTIHLKSADTASLSTIADEINILIRLQHPNIVQYFYCEEQSDSSGIHMNVFMELCKGGSLQGKLGTTESKMNCARRPNEAINNSTEQFSGPFALSEVISTVVQITDALAYLHSQHIVHRDIKPGNLLLSDGKVKMADFGTATLVSQGTVLKETAGTFTYMAPEVYNGLSYSYPCDIWSIGCVVLDLLGTNIRKAIVGTTGGATIFSGGYFSECTSDEDIHNRIRSYIHHSDLCDFLVKCFRLSPTDRATAAELQQHPLLTQHTQKQVDFVRQSSMFVRNSASAADWRVPRVAASEAVRASGGALSIASADEDEDPLTIRDEIGFEEDRQDEDRPSPDNEAKAMGSTVAPLTLDALKESSDNGSPLALVDSPVFGLGSATSNMWHTSIASPLHVTSPVVHTASASAWNPLWGSRPLQSPSRRKMNSATNRAPTLNTTGRDKSADDRPSTADRAFARIPQATRGRIVAASQRLPPLAKH